MNKGGREKTVGWIRIFFFTVFLGGTVFFPVSATVFGETAVSGAEIERFVRARIDIGESMRDFFRNRQPPQFGPEGGPSMEALRRLEAEINDNVARILAKYDLTIPEYRARSKAVFSDEAGVDRFLEAHPGLKARYRALPRSPRRGSRR